ncbi:unnamed protein product [Mesocestoides corti]|uniref:Uncharacterized protein n=1 Tax=Mesocestoides corti TaxID=53468 RepID=A0A0R3UD78_MESCO|nr:unnamed protein product [Mesocestoides corti]
MLPLACLLPSRGQGGGWLATKRTWVLGVAWKASRRRLTSSACGQSGLLLFLQTFFAAAAAAPVLVNPSSTCWASVVESSHQEHVADSATGSGRMIVLEGWRQEIAKQLTSEIHELIDEKATRGSEDMAEYRRV